MLIRTPADLGAVIRDRRQKSGLDQAGLAARVGVNRKWIIGIEQGRARAEMGLVLRALSALGLRLDASPETGGGMKAPSVDIDKIVTAARKSNL